MRDMSPEDEVAIWASITAAWLAYHEKYLDDKALPEDQERTLIAALIVISTGCTDVTKLKVPEDVGRKLLQCYDELSQG